jgi:hypothetical protein
MVCRVRCGETDPRALIREADFIICYECHAKDLGGLPLKQTTSRPKACGEKFAPSRIASDKFAYMTSLRIALWVRSFAFRVAIGHV